jgi:tetratricopeptide (TPR) repeat protein
VAVAAALAVWLVPAPVGAQKDVFVQALRPFYSALAGVYGDEGPQLAAHLETLATALERWDRSLAVTERQLRGRLNDGNASTGLEVHTVLASLYAERSRFPEALQEIDAAIGLDATRPSLHRFKALLCQSMNRSTEAADSFRAAWLLEPDAAQNAYHLVVHRSAKTTAADVDRALATLKDVERALVRGQSVRANAPFLTLNAIDEDAGKATAFAPAPYAQGFAQVLRGEFDAGIGALRDAVAVDPLVGDHNTRAEPMTRGIAALRQGHVAAAVEDLTVAVARAPESSEAHRVLATALLVNGDVDRSVRHLREAVRLNPRDERAWLALARILDDTGELEQAADVLRRAADALPRAGAIRWLLSVLSAKREQTTDADLELIAGVERLVVLAGRGEMYRRVARLAQDHLDFESATRLLEKQAALTPNDPAAHQALGAAFLDRGRDDLAYAEFVVALQLDPMDAGALTALGLLHLAANEYDRAVDALQRAVALAPSFGPALQGLGQALVRAGQVADGQNRLAESARLQSAATTNRRRMRTAATLRARAQQEMLSAEHARAIATLQQVIPMEPGYADNHVRLADALIAQKQFAEAAAHLQTAISLKAGIDAYRRLASVYVVLGRRDEAERARQTYVELRLQELRERAGT